MAQMNFGTRPPLLARSSVLPVDPNSPPTKPPMRQMPMGRPPTDFGGVQAQVMPPNPGNGMLFGEGVNVAPNPVTRGGRPARPYPPSPSNTLTGVSQPAINDLTPGGTVAMAPRPMGGLTATGMRPYDPNRRRREPGLR